MSSELIAHWELFYADDLAIIAELLGELKVRIKNWKDEWKRRDLKVNIEGRAKLCALVSAKQDTVPKRSWISLDLQKHNIFANNPSNIRNNMKSQIKYKN